MFSWLVKRFFPSRQYNLDYYQKHCGPVPYGYTVQWLNFFSYVADLCIKEVNPILVLDAGCAWGILVAAFRERGVAAYGIDFSKYAISQVRDCIKSYCRVASLTEPIKHHYSMVTCIEVVEHMSEEDGKKAIRNICSITDIVLFSSTPDDTVEPTHINVQPKAYWVDLFAQQGLKPDETSHAFLITPHAILFRRG